MFRALMVPLGSMPMAALAPANPRSRLSRRTEDGLVGGVIVLAAMVAALSPGEPTGLGVWDTVLKAFFAAAVVVAASRSQRWAVMVLAMVAAAASFFEPWALAAWAGLAVAMSSALLDRRSRLAGALAAALAVQAVLRLPAVGFFGLQSLVAAVCVAPALLSGYRYGTRSARKLTRRALGATAVATAVILLFGGLAMLDARSDVDRGVAAARRGLQAARSGDTQAIVDELGLAETDLGAAESRLSGFGARLLRLVPVAAQHQRAIESATAEGAVLARQASATFRAADISSISLQAGSVDLVALRAMGPELRATSELLENALVQLKRNDSPWLLPAVTGRIGELADEIEGLLPEVALGADAAQVVPAMLGADTPMTYFVFFGTPAESREMGGFVGSWAVITFDQGRLSLDDSGRIQQLYPQTRQTEVAAGTVSDWFLEMARPTRFPQNLTSSPDFGQVAAVSRQVLAGVVDTELAGFVYMDAHSVIDFLELTGPVPNPITGEDLNATNGADFFFDQQYRAEEGRTEIFDSLDGVARTVLARLDSQTLPGPERLGQVLGPGARAGHLQVVTFDDAQNNFLRSIHLLRDFGRTDTTDFVGLVQTNGLSNKMDLYLHRTLTYDVAIDDGDIVAEATATLRSDVPDDAPAFVLGGETAPANKVLLSLYSPHRLTGATINGEPVEVRTATEFGMGRYLVEVDVPPVGEVVVRFALTGELDPATDYSLEIWQQPLVNVDQVQVSVAGSAGEISWFGELIETMTFVASS